MLVISCLLAGVFTVASVPAIVHPGCQAFAVLGLVVAAAGVALVKAGLWPYLPLLVSRTQHLNRLALQTFFVVAVI